jgi:regulator of protease activity HflC (stomatin/prohibitin superfamily)
VALVDTSVRRLQFTADQVTREKVGVAVTGLAVFRIVEPLLAWRTLDLGQGEAYAEILREMFVGATRRLVANLGLEECLTRRKDALAAELMCEVAPVVQGDGRAEDCTERGWGIAIDTIEIQDVKILSEEVFSNLQAPYRQSLELEALKARSEVEKEQQRIEVAQRRDEELARQAQMELEKERLVAEAGRRRQAAQHATELARMELEAHIDRTETEAASTVRIAQQQAEAERTRGQARADVVAMERRAAAEPVSEQRLQEMMLTETLPRVAEAFADSFDQVVLTGGGGGMDFLGQGIAQVLATARGFGIQLPSGRDED